MRWLPSAFAALCLAAAPMPVLAATYGLVIGIDEYDAAPDLDGSVADAEDIAAALDAYGAAKVVKLTNADANRSRIVSEFDALVAEAAPGDTLIFTYSGHGTQAPAFVPEAEPDGLDEFFQLGRFDPSRMEETKNERIFDQEIRAWLLRAQAKGMRVIFVADSCHSGGMDRALGLKTRLAPRVEVPSEPPSAEALSGERIKEDEFKSVVFLAASLESQPTPEVVIDGQPRGALSYAFARALEGKADLDGNGRITRIELEDYVLPIVKQESEALQTPEFRPRNAEAMRSTVLGEVQQALDNPLKTEPPADVHDLPFTVSGGTLPVNLDGVINGGNRPFRYDVTEQRLYSPFGDVAAERLLPNQLQPAIDKYRLLSVLKEESRLNTGAIILSPAKPLYKSAERLSLSARSWTKGYVLMFNLANTGEVQYLGSFSDGAGEAVSLGQFAVTPPYGADHLIVMSLEKDGKEIDDLLQKPGIRPGGLIDRFRDLFAHQKAKVAIQPFYTESL